ncbi:MAG TPA: M48 family metallopeptidase [Chitinophagaceae bacterium]|nr:M48 family metallopeptidase [Chitinophagaceae bacterium]
MNTLSRQSLFLRVILLFLFYGSQIVNAQSKVFTPAVEDAAFLNNLYTKYEKVYKNSVVSLPKENRKDFEMVYQHRWENIKEKFDNKEIYTSASARQYLDDLVTQVIKANPELQNTVFNAYFSRTHIPNAAYVGEGIILFNLGLLQKLNNESQLMFVLCHEIAHFYLRHSENSIRKYVATVNSEDVQKELQKINKSEYRKKEQLEKLVKGLTFNSSRHSRDHESSADSMAIVFMRNTKFDVSEALTALAMLDSIDRENFNTNDYLEKIFDSKEYPFQKKWTAREEGLLGGHAQVTKDEALADSLKTHPDCQVRIEALKPLVNKYRSANSVKNFDKIRFEELRHTAQYEIIEYAYSSNNYTASLYHTLKLLQTNPGDAYLITQVGRIFNGFYSAQKEHTLGKFIRLPSPYFPPNYNALLQFIQNLYLQDFAQLSYTFLKPYQQQLDNYPPFKLAYNTSIQITKPNN